MTPAAASTALYLSVTCVVIPLGGALYVGFLAGHAADIARSWADGCKQLTAWRAAACRVLVPLAVTALVWVRNRVRPHGVHRRAGVTT